MAINHRAIFLWICLSTAMAQQCIDDSGDPVDWFFGYKVPALKNQENKLLQSGYGYLFITSKNSKANWKVSEYSVNDSESFFGRSLAPIYSSSSYSLLYLLYNDDPPSNRPLGYYAHAKGVVIANATSGMWLVHSCPKFPIEPVTVKKVKDSGPKKPPSKYKSYKFKEATETIKNEFGYPATATKYGQSILCLSLPGSQMNKVGLALQLMRPQVYSSNVPDNLGAKYPDLADAARKRYVKNPPWYLKTNLKTHKGTVFTSYAKASQFNKDLYSNWLADDLKSNLEVETWSNGPNELPSNCKKKYSVMDILTVNIETEEGLDILFKNSQDHSKWAVTTSSRTKRICVGDINRMESQSRRGGGTVCFANPYVWRRYSSAVQDVQPCAKNVGDEN